MKNLKSIAKQWKTITFNQFKAIYNNLKIVNPQDVAKLSKITISDNQILIMATKRPENPTKPPVWFTSYMSRFEKKINQKFENKMPTWFKKWNKEVFKKIIKLNNLKTK